MPLFDFGFSELTEAIFAGEILPVMVLAGGLAIGIWLVMEMFHYFEVMADVNKKREKERRKLELRAEWAEEKFAREEIVAAKRREAAMEKAERERMLDDIFEPFEKRDREDVEEWR